MVLKCGERLPGLIIAVLAGLDVRMFVDRSSFDLFRLLRTPFMLDLIVSVSCAEAVAAYTSSTKNAAAFHGWLPV